MHLGTLLAEAEELQRTSEGLRRRADDALRQQNAAGYLTALRERATLVATFMEKVPTLDDAGNPAYGSILEQASDLAWLARRALQRDGAFVLAAFLTSKGSTEHEPDHLAVFIAELKQYAR